MKPLIYFLGVALFLLIVYSGFLTYKIFQRGWLVVGGKYGHEVTKAHQDIRYISSIITERQIQFEPPKDSDIRSGPISEVWPELYKTPIGALAKSEDPFNKGIEYWSARWKRGFLLASVGPDGVLDITDEVILDAMQKQIVRGEALQVLGYNPTNGSDTKGDLLKLHQF